MTASTPFASWASFAVLALCALAAHGQINPATQIKWPLCTGTAQVYSIVTNTCIVAGGGGGGGASPNPPDYSIQFAIGALFGSDPNITIDPVMHTVQVGPANANPTFHMTPVGTILADWTFNIVSPIAAINSLTGASTEGYLWTYHLGSGAWRPAPVSGVSSVTPGSGITCSPLLAGTCVGAITLNSTASTGFGAITSGTNTGAAMIVGSGASLTPTGSGKITATHSTQTGLTQCLESLTDGTIVGSGAQCNLWTALTGGTLTSQVLHLGSGSSLDRTGGATIDASAIGGVVLSGTPTAGQQPVATGATTATWQTVGTGPTTTCNSNGCYQVGADGSLLEWGTVTATGGGTGGTFTITLPFAMSTTTNQWVQVVASYCNLGSPSSCAGGSGGSNASTPAGGLETGSTTAPTIAWWDANSAPGTIEFTWTARGK